MQKFLFSDAGRLTFGAVLATVVFIIDAIIPLGVSGGVPYVAIVLAGMWIAWQPAILILAGLATLLTIAGFYISPPGGETWPVLANRTLTVAMIWTVAFVVHYRRRREDQMVDRERALGTAIVQGISAMVIIVDPTGHIVRCNRTCEEITGRTQAQLIGMKLDNLIDRMGAGASVEPAFGTETAARKPFRCETFIRSRGNGRRRISWSSTPHFGTAGAVDYLILAGIDITEQYRAREELRKSEELHRTVVENQIDLIARSLPDGTLTFVNDVYCKFFGKPREKLIGSSFILSVHESDRDAVKENLAERTRAPTEVSMEIRMLGGNGDIRWVQWTAKPIFSGDGKILEYQSVGRDVTERRRMEDALRESEARFKAVVDHSPSFIMLLDIESRLLMVNKPFQEYFSRSESDLIGKKVDDFVPSALSAKLRKDDDEVITHGRAVEQEIDMEFLDGRTQTRLVSKFPVSDADGKIIAFGVISSDITERKRAEENLKESEERHRQLADISPLAILVQCDNRIVFANPAAIRLYRANAPEDLIGREALDFIHPKDRTRVRAYCLEIERSQALRLELGTVTRLRLDGSEFLGDGVGARLRWSGKDAFLAVIQDVTDLRRAEGDLRKAKDLAEQANATKSRFLAAASHDLRQPLYAMSLFLATLMERFNEPAYAILLEKMEQSLESANKLLGTVLDISKLEAGVVMPELTDFPIQSVLDQTAIEFAPVAEAAGNSLTIMPCGAFVRSDRALLESIVRNLVSNAVRYTGGGRILVGCRRRAGAIRIVVRDTGPGIPPEMHKRIFNEFERLDNPPDMGANGLGLGLAIVDRTAKLLGCEIELESDVGKGAVFAFEVPLGKTVFKAPVTSEPPQSIASSNLRNATIALIEDDPSILLAIPEYLARWGCICVTADSGDGAVRNLGRAGQVPDLLLADYHLSNGETGLDAIRILRSKWGQDIPAVIVTADTSPKTASLTKEAGIALLTKPVRPAKLRAMLHYLLRIDSEQPPITAAAPDSALTPQPARS